MGAGIVQVFLEAGCGVHLVERDDTAADLGVQRVAAGLRRRFASADDGDTVVGRCLGRLTRGTSLEVSAPPALAIESVFENYGVKQDVLAVRAPPFPTRSSRRTRAPCR